MESADQKIARLEAENASLRAQFLAKEPRNYTAEKVVLASWKTSNLMMEKELETLKRIFEDDYHFEVLCILIPASHSARHLKSQVNFFLKDKKPETLWVFMYAGHGGRFKFPHTASKIFVWAP